jgi:hypothetical protein
MFDKSKQSTEFNKPTDYNASLVYVMILSYIIFIRILPSQLVSWRAEFNFSNSIVYYLYTSNLLHLYKNVDVHLFQNFMKQDFQLFCIQLLIIVHMLSSREPIALYY